MPKVAPEPNDDDEQYFETITCFKWRLAITILVAGILAFLLYKGLSTITLFILYGSRLHTPDYGEMLNRTFISSKIEMNSVPELGSIQEEMFHEFNSTLYKLHHCSLRPRVLFYGESGIGKTTVMRAVLQRFHPNPFIYIDLEAELSWKYLAQSLGISPWNEKHSLKDLIYNTIVSYTTRYKENLINNCPVLILDSANRKPNITNQIIQFLRNEPTSTIALVVLSSYRNYHMINNAGRRVKQIELLEASKSFGVNFLRGMEIPEHLIEGILEITGQKPLYLQTAVELYKYRQTNNEEFL